MPLLIVPPRVCNPSTVVGETVSLRDLPATIVDLVGQGNGSPFPGESLARFWGDPGQRVLLRPATDDPVVSELVAPNPARPNQGRSPAAVDRSSHWPKATSFIFATKAMAASNSSTSATILRRLTTGAGSNQCVLCSRNSATVSI